MRGERIVHQVFLGLGSNLGDREKKLQEAIRLIGEQVGKVVRQSTFIETEPWGFDSDNMFMNAVILCETEHTPREVLTVTQQIERNMGRRKKSVNDQSVNGKSVNRKYFDRPIDIDILLYDDITIDDPDLKIPHPLMHQRDFVMVPLNEIRNNK